MQRWNGWGNPAMSYPLAASARQHLTASLGTGSPPEDATLEQALSGVPAPRLPASAAGPDLRQLVLGSEGRLGVITRAVVRVQTMPAYERFHAAPLPEWEVGLSAVREITQSDLPLSMLRLSDPAETETTLALADRERLVELGGRAAGLLGMGAGRCLLLYGLTGERRSARAASQVILRHAGTISHQHGVGLDHREFLTAEKGPLGMQVLRAACRALDPDGLMNPGRLLEPAE